MPKRFTVPWMLPALFAPTPKRFDPSGFTGVEVRPVRRDGNCLLSLTREQADAAPESIAAWSVYLISLEGYHDCVADLSNEPAAMAIGAALAAQYGLAFDEADSMFAAIGGLHFAIQAEYDFNREETCFQACEEGEAEQWAIYAQARGLGAGGSMLVHDCPSRAEAVAFINRQRSGRLLEGNCLSPSDIGADAAAVAQEA